LFNQTGAVVVKELHGYFDEAISQSNNAHKVQFQSYLKTTPSAPYSDSWWEAGSFAGRSPDLTFKTPGGNFFPYKYVGKMYSTETETEGASEKMFYSWPMPKAGSFKDAQFEGEFDISSPYLIHVSWYTAPAKRVLRTNAELLPPPQMHGLSPCVAMMTLDLVEADKQIRLCGTLLYSDNLQNGDRKRVNHAVYTLLSSCPYYGIGDEVSHAPGTAGARSHTVEEMRGLLTSQTR
jgi:hypothetical protein